MELRLDPGVITRCAGIEGVHEAISSQLERGDGIEMLLGR